MAPRRSAGILLYRRRTGGFEVLLGHPGGPFYGRKDGGVWSIPKGEPDKDEASDADHDLLSIARREFTEETGHDLPRGGELDLGTITQKGGKVVRAWAVEGDLDPAAAHSNTFEMVWPPGSGTLVAYPEIDRVAWFDAAEARRRVKAAQIPFIDRLEAALAAG